MASLVATVAACRQADDFAVDGTAAEVPGPLNTSSVSSVITERLSGIRISKSEEPLEHEEESEGLAAVRGTRLCFRGVPRSLEGANPPRTPVPLTSLEGERPSVGFLSLPLDLATVTGIDGDNDPLPSSRLMSAPWVLLP